MSMAAIAPADRLAVEAIVQRAGTSFYRGMRVLSPDRRTAMYAIYAYSRLVDDVADEPAPLPDKLRDLAAWRERIAAVFGGTGSDPVTRVLVGAAQTYGLRHDDFVAVIDGMQMDAATVIVAPDLATLDLYCDRVAAAVGRLSVRAFGDGSPAADQVAWHLGRALQHTNILRDVAEDVGRGRLYLPAEWLADAGVLADIEVPPNPALARVHPGLPAVCTRMAATAHAHFASARRAMADCDRRAMRPAQLMAATYDALLDRLEARGWTQLDTPVRVPKWQKLVIAARHLL